MFEKEAEENGFGIGCTVNPTTAFQKGAEFGYNKANDWCYVKDELPAMDVFVYLWKKAKIFL